MKSNLTIRLAWAPNVFLAGIILFSCFCSALRIEIGSVGISLSHLTIPFLVVFPLMRKSWNHLKVPLFYDNASVFLYLTWAVSLVSTILLSGLPARSITGSINFSSFILLFIAIQWLLMTIDPNRIVKTLLKSANVSAIIGLFCLVGAMISGQPNIGATYDHINQLNLSTITKAIPSIRSLSIEPNLFGILTASVLAIYVAIYFDQKSKRVLNSILLLGTVLVLSYTRSAFIGLIIAILLMAILSKKWSIISTVIKSGVVGILFFGLLLAVLPSDSSFKKAISYKLGSGMFDFSSETGIPRLTSFHESINGFSKSPLIGNGIFSANNVFVNPNTFEVTGTAGPIGWLNGLFIQALHDSGIIGLLGWCFFFFFLVYKNYKMYKRLPPSFEKSVMLGFVGGNIVIFVGSQASSIVWIAFPFVYWGINLTLLRQYRTKIEITEV